MWSKSGASTLTRKQFLYNDTSCQSLLNSETIVTGVCSSTFTYEFAGEGPGTVFELFTTKTCDPGTSTGKRDYGKTDTCYEGSGRSSKMVCESRKLVQYVYTSGNCTSGETLGIEVAVCMLFANIVVKVATVTPYLAWIRWCTFMYFSMAGLIEAMTSGSGVTILDIPRDS
eukprot:Skav227739  [mRNA]  locus=scaffold3513:149923:152285:+ [translate_table: standard]